MIPPDDGCTRVAGRWEFRRAQRPSVWTVWLEENSTRMPGDWLVEKLRALEQYEQGNQTQGAL